MDDIDYGRSGVLNPANLMSKPFDHVCKPPLLLERLTNKQKSSHITSPSIHDPAYKFDFLHDVANVDTGSLPLIGGTESTLPTPFNHLASNTTPLDHNGAPVSEDHLDLVLGHLPRVPSFRAH